MQTNWKLLTCIIVLVVVISASAGLAFGLTADNRLVDKVVDNMQSNQFKGVDLVVKQDNLVVYSNINGTIVNPMGLEIVDKTDVAKLNWDKRNMQGDTQKTDKVYLYSGTIKDAKRFCGKQIADMTIQIQVNRASKSVDKVVIKYTDRGFEITITAHKDTL